MAIRLAIDGDLRFISHHDTLRLFERALSRAQLPVKYSEGFNPRPRLWLPLPRPVGVASQVEIAVIQFYEPLQPSALLDRLAGQLPPDLELLEAWTMSDEYKFQAERVEYELAVPAHQSEALTQALGQLLEARRWPVQRRQPGGKPDRETDLRSYLLAASIDAGLMRWTFGVTGSGSARPGEFLSAVGLDSQAWLHRVRRIRIHWLCDHRS